MKKCNESEIFLIQIHHKINDNGGLVIELMGLLKTFCFGSKMLLLNIFNSFQNQVIFSVCRSGK